MTHAHFLQAICFAIASWLLFATFLSFKLGQFVHDDPRLFGFIVRNGVRQ